MNENKRTAKFTFTKVSMVMLLYELIFQVGSAALIAFGGETYANEDLSMLVISIVGLLVSFLILGNESGPFVEYKRFTILRFFRAPARGLRSASLFRDAVGSADYLSRRTRPRHGICNRCCNRRNYRFLGSRLLHHRGTALRRMPLPRPLFPPATPLRPDLCDYRDSTPVCTHAWKHYPVPDCPFRRSFICLCPCGLRPACFDSPSHVEQSLRHGLQWSQ